jgi:hypothetical protein
VGEQVVEVQRVGLELPVGQEHVLVQVAVHVAQGQTHAAARIVEARLERHVAEAEAGLGGARLVEHVHRHVVGDVQVVAAVLVVVPEDRLHAAALDVEYAELRGAVDELQSRAIALVLEVRVALTGEREGQHRHRVFAGVGQVLHGGHLALVVLQVGGHVEVQVAVAIGVAGADTCTPQGSAVGPAHAGGLADVVEAVNPALLARVVLVQGVRAVVGHEEVEVAVAGGVEEQRAHTGTLVLGAGHHFDTGSIGPVEVGVELIGEVVLVAAATALNDVQLQGAVAVRIAGSDSRSHRRANVELLPGAFEVHAPGPVVPRLEGAGVERGPRFAGRSGGRIGTRHARSIAVQTDQQCPAAVGTLGLRGAQAQV